MTYGVFETAVDVPRAQATILPYTIWMTPLDTRHEREIVPRAHHDQVITNPSIPGLEVIIPAGSVLRDEDGNVVRRLGITPIPLDRPPFPLPGFEQFPLYYTVQPGGTYIWPHGARIVYPNATHQPPGARIEFWNYDPDRRGWYVYGHGTVTPDGSQVIPDKGVSVYEFTGAMVNDGETPPPTKPCPEEDIYYTWAEPDPSSCLGGDPVDLSSGLFVYRHTDLYLPGPLPIRLTRTYRQSDPNARAFGVGMNFPFGIFLWSANQYQEADLITPSGSRIHYIRTSPGTSWGDAIFQTTSAPGAFYSSTIVWNGNGWDLRLKNGMVYVFGANAPLQAIRDRFGNQLTLARTMGQRGNITQISAPGGRWIKFTYNANNDITQAQDNAGRTVTYGYDGAGRLTSVTDPNSGVTQYGWDTANNRMTSITDPRGITYLQNQYDTNGRVSGQTLGGNSTYAYVYTLDQNGKVTRTDVTDPRGSVQRMAFNSDGFPTSVIRALGSPEEESLTLDRQTGTNLITSITDALSRRTDIGYDPIGNVTSTTRLAGTGNAVTTSFSYDPTFSQVTSATDPLNHSTTLSYDSLGNLTSVTDPLNHSSTFAHNAAGQLTSITDPLGHLGRFVYELGDPVGTVDPLGRSTSWFVDAVGRRVSKVDPMGNLTRYDYDSRNELTTITNPLGATTSFGYDADGNLTSVTDARAHTTSYTYDSLDHLQTQTDPLQRVWNYQFDSLGNLTQLTDARGTITVAHYDGLNRRTFSGFGASGGSYEGTINYTYDLGNRLTSAIDSDSGTVTRTYDGLDRLTSEASPQGSISYTYDSAGRRASMTVAGQPAVSYSWDAANRLTQLARGSSVVSFAYDDAGRRTSVVLPDGISEDYTFDPAAEITAVGYNLSGNSLGDLSYVYDPDGRRTSVGGSFSRTGLPGAVASATYDAANEVTNWNGTSLSHDLNGFLTSDGSNSYSWDARRRLSSISGPTSASFSYDAFGRRTRASIGGATTKYLYDRLNSVQEQSIDGTPVANLLTGLGVDRRFERTDSQGPRDYLIDANASTLALADASGLVQTSYTYEPFGATTSTGQTSTNPYQFVGRESDATGLDYFRARYYSPSLGSFLGPDPLGAPMAKGFGPYVYAYDNPVLRRDPLGLCPDQCTGIFGCVWGWLTNHWQDLLILGLDLAALSFTVYGFGLFEAALPLSFSLGGAAAGPLGWGIAFSFAGLVASAATGGSGADLVWGTGTNALGVAAPDTPGWGVVADIEQFLYDWQNTFSGEG